MAEEKQAERLTRLKMLLVIEGGKQDGLLSFLIEDTENLILGYCRLEIMPRQLESFVPVIAADMYRRKVITDDTAEGRIKSISQGEQSVTLISGTLETDEFLTEYEARLKPYVNRRGRVPSDLSGGKSNEIQ